MKITLTGAKDDGNLFLIPFTEKFDGNYFSFLAHRYNTWSSRIIIEFFTLISVTHPTIWKILNATMMVVGAVMPTFIIKRSNTIKITDLILSTSLFLTFPLSFFSETGWVATTTNYLWAYAMGLIAIYPLVRYTRQERPIKWLTIVGILATIYATNQEQMSLLLLAFTVILLLFNLYKKRAIKPFIPNILINSIVLIMTLTAKGNSIRYAQELKNWFPDFEQLSFTRKIELGYSSTLRHLFFDKQWPILLFLFLLFTFTVFGFIRRKKISLIGISGLIPLPIALVFSFNDITKPNRITQILNQFNQYGTMFRFNQPSTWMPDLILTIVLFSILLSIFYLLDYQQSAYLPMLFILAALLARMIMGFSPTIWASATRTYIFTYGLFSLTALYLFEKYPGKTNSKILILLVSLLVGAYTLFQAFLSV